MGVVNKSHHNFTERRCRASRRLATPPDASRRLLHEHMTTADALAREIAEDKGRLEDLEHHLANDPSLSSLAVLRGELEAERDALHAEIERKGARLKRLRAEGVVLGIIATLCVLLVFILYIGLGFGEHLFAPSPSNLFQGAPVGSSQAHTKSEL